MSSRGTDMFKEILYNIREDISKLTDNSNALMKNQIKDRLDYSLELYKENLENTCRYVLSKNPLTMLKGFVQEIIKDR
jgi:hypothetical protein